MQQQFAVVSGKMTVEVNGQEYTLQQASNFWKVTTVSCANLFTGRYRNAAYKTGKSFMICFTQLIERRHKVAVNAGLPIIVTISSWNLADLITIKRIATVFMKP